MTKEAFCARVLDELRITHPSLDWDAVQIFALHAHNLLLYALGSRELTQDDIPLAEDLTLWRYNRAGSEGISSETLSGMEQQFEDDLPKPLKRAIAQRRRIRWS